MTLFFKNCIPCKVCGYLVSFSYKNKLMVIAILIGRRGSTGLPEKNTMNVLGRPLTAYPIIAAQDSKVVDQIFLSTDDPEIKRIGREYGATIIDRPDHLCTKTALGEDAFAHAYQVAKDRNPNQSIETVVLLFCNSPTVLPDHIRQGVELLKMNPRLDSAVTVSRYNMWSPLRARKLTADGTLQPFVPFEVFGDPKTLNCDRDSQGDVLFADMGVSVVRSKCLEDLSSGLLPQRWMGRKIAPIRNEAGCDIDYAWQIPQTEWWLKTYRPELF